MKQFQKSQDGNNPSPHYFFLKIKMVFILEVYKVYIIKTQKNYFMLVIWVLMKELSGGDPESGKLIQNFRRILAYEIRTRKDLFLNSASGMLGGRLITHDIYKKELYSDRI